MLFVELNSLHDGISIYGKILYRIYGGGLVGWFLDFILYLMYAEASHQLILYFS